MQRHERPHRPSRRASRHFASLLALAFSLAPLPLSAQVDEGFSAQNFRPPIDPFGYVVTNGARSLEPGQIFVAAYVDYAKDPLDLRDIREGVIEEMTFVHAVAAIGLMDVGKHGGLSMGVVVPYALQMEGFGRDPNAGTPDTVTPPAVELPDGRLADIRAELKLTLFDRSELLGVAFRGYGVFPTGEDKYFLSNDERFGAGGGVVLEKEMGPFRIGGEFGYEWIEGDTIISTVPLPPDDDDDRTRLLTIDDKLHMRAGIATRLFVDDLWLVLEGHHWVRASHPYDTFRESPLEVGAAIRFDRGLLFVLGASTGITEGVGAPSYRGYASLGYAF